MTDRLDLAARVGSATRCCGSCTASHCRHCCSQRSHAGDLLGFLHQALCACQSNRRGRGWRWRADVDELHSLHDWLLGRRRRRRRGRGRHRDWGTSCWLRRLGYCRCSCRCSYLHQLLRSSSSLTPLLSLWHRSLQLDVALTVDERASTPVHGLGSVRRIWHGCVCLLFLLVFLFSVAHGCCHLSIARGIFAHSSALVTVFVFALAASWSWAARWGWTGFLVFLLLRRSSCSWA